MRDNPAPVDVSCRQGLEKAKEVIASGKYDMIILDEINVAMDFKLIPEDDAGSAGEQASRDGHHSYGKICYPKNSGNS